MGGFWKCRQNGLLCFIPEAEVMGGTNGLDTGRRDPDYILGF